MIPFNIPPCTGRETEYIAQAIYNKKICGDGNFTKKCGEWLKKSTGTQKVLLTTSCTHALEMAAILCNIKPGDEVIMPSYTFVSTASAFVREGAKIVFIDIRPDTMNIDENLIEQAITPKTKVIVPVHYAGVSCEMDVITNIAQKYNLLVVEDAAQGMMCEYKGKSLGSIGDFGCVSFHETKNYSMGEGGAIFVNNDKYRERAEIIREKGTDRSKFLRGEIDKYTWVDYGSSYLPSELNAAYLYPQLEDADIINNYRLSVWQTYYEGLECISNMIELPHIPPECRHNAHMFYIKAADLSERTELLSYLRNKNIFASFHYVPLHTSSAGLKYGRFDGEDIYTTKESSRLLRLPMYYGILDSSVHEVIEAVKTFFTRRLL